MRRAGAQLLCVLALVAIAGCGGSETKTVDKTVEVPAGPTGKLTRQQFLAKLNSLCKYSNQTLSPYDDKVSKLENRLNSTTGEEQQTAENNAARVIRREVTVTRRVVDRARAIQPPKSERAFYDAFMDNAVSKQVVASQVADALENSDTERMSSLISEGDKLVAEHRGLLIGHGGLPNCHRD